ncbi:MAG: hypothetical protein Q9199_006903 [Rusavskia elegans]
MRYSSLAALALISTVIAMPTPHDSFSEAETQGDGPAPVDSGLFPCGPAYYAPDQYICYGDFLCPILDGEPTLQCGGACYLETLYSCDEQGTLVSLSENDITDDSGETATVDGEDPTQTGADSSEPTSSGIPSGDDDTSSSSDSSSDSSGSSNSDSDSPSADGDSSSSSSSSSDSGSGTVEKRDPRAPCRKYFRQPGRRC